MSTVTKPIALDETLQSTNTALGSLGKDTTLQAIATAIANVGLSNIGNMSSLATTDKTSLVSAINEVVGDVSDLDTDKADKVASATNGNLAGLNASGNLTDSGWASDKTTTSASGNPISITGLKSNQLAVNPVITFEPIQDLHGQSNPYPAGGSKNIAPITLTKLKTLNSGGSSSWSGNAYTLYGVTYTIVVDNDDNILSIKTSGTSTGVSALKLTDSVNNFLTAGQTITYSGCPSGGTDSTYNITIGTAPNTGRWGTDKGSGSTLTTPSLSGQHMYIVVFSGVNANNLVWYPQIELGSSKTSYVPSSNICPISSYDKIEVSHYGKNLMPIDDVNLTVDKNAWYNFSGTRAHIVDDCTKLYLAKGTYYIKLNNVSGTSNLQALKMVNNEPVVLVDYYVTEGSFTISENETIYFRFKTNATSVSFKPMLNRGSTALPYEPYHKTTDLSENLPQTVYGGSLDVRTGKLLNIDEKYTFGSYSGGVQIALESSTRKLYTIDFSDAIIVDNGNTQKLAISDKLKSMSAYDLLNNNAIDIVYQLATPTEIQLTPHEISLLKDYAYVSTNGTSMSFDYHNGEIATLGDVSQLGETVENANSYILDNIIGTVSHPIPESNINTIGDMLGRFALYLYNDTNGGGSGLCSKNGFYIVIARHNTDTSAYYIGFVYKAPSSNPVITEIASNLISIRAVNTSGTVSFNYNGTTGLGDNGKTSSYLFLGNAIF